MSDDPRKMGGKWYSWKKQLNWRGKTTQLEGKNNSTGGEKQLNWRGKTTQLEGKNNSTGGEKQLNWRGKQLNWRGNNSTGGCLFVFEKKSHLLGGPERKTSGVCEFFQAQVTIIKDSMISQQNWCKIDFISHTKRLV